MAEKLTTLAKRLRPFIIGQTAAAAAAGGIMTEGPGIDLAGAAIGLGGDTILIYNSDGTPVEEFAATSAGLVAALAAADAGDTVILPSIEITGGPWTVPANVELTGIGTKSSLVGNLTNNGRLSNLSINGNVTNNASIIYCTFDNETVGGNIVTQSAANASIVDSVIDNYTTDWGLYITDGSAIRVTVSKQADVDTKGVYANGATVKLHYVRSAGEIGMQVETAQEVINCLAYGRLSGGLRHTTGTAVISNCYFYEDPVFAGTAYGVVLTAGGLTFIDTGWESINGSAFITYGTGDRAPDNHTHSAASDVDFYDPYTNLISFDGFAGYFINPIAYRYESISSVTISGTTYQAYCFWDKNNHLVIGKRVLDGAWTLYTYDGTGGRPDIPVVGDDNHDVASLGIDPNGFIHVAYAMHDEALKYRKSDAAISTWTGGVTAEIAMLGGVPETAVTYPMFFNDPAGALYFIYRYWTLAGEGKIYFYKYNHAGTAWAAATGTSTAGLLINPETIGPITYRAYYGKPCFDADFGSGGFLHIEFNWRDISTVEMQDLCYVRWDGTNFTQADGTAQTVPITKTNAEQVEAIAAGSGLAGGNSVYSDSSGYPHIAYSRFGVDGFRHIFHAWYNGAAWVIRQISTSQAEAVNPITNPNYGLQPLIFMDRDTDVAYIAYVDDRDMPGLLVQVSGANDFTSWERISIYPLPTGWYEPKIDTKEWARSKVAYIPIEYWLTDWTTGETSLPIRLLRWDPALNQEYLTGITTVPVTLDADAATILDITGQELGLDVQTANTVLAGPTTGAANEPTFRALVSADLPAITLNDLSDVDTAGADAGEPLVYNGASWIPGAAASVDLPYGSFSSSATQTIASATTAYAITYTDRELTNQVTLSSNSHINILVAGTYLITFSAIGASSAPNKYLDIWLSVDGTNVPRSNTHSEFVGTHNERIITVTYVYDFAAGQYFELYMHSNDTGATLVATAAGASPTRPASPSIIVTVNKISDTNSDSYLLMETGDRLLLETGDKIFLE